jgi:hypothetical protein
VCVWGGCLIFWSANSRAQAEGAARGGAHRAAAVEKEVNARLGRLGQVFDVVLDQVERTAGWMEGV